MTSEGEQRRLAIQNAINENPGLTFRALSRATGIPSGTLRHHINVLLRRGSAWLLLVESRHLHFAGPRPDSANAVRAAWHEALPEGMQTLLIDALCAKKQADLLDARPEPRSTTQHHLSMLTRWGFLSRVGGRSIHYERPGHEHLGAMAHTAWELAHA